MTQEEIEDIESDLIPKVAINDYYSHSSHFNCNKYQQAKVLAPDSDIEQDNEEDNEERSDFVVENVC